MVAESAENFDQLEAQAAQLVERFCVAGYEFVAPSIIQPADVFLDAVGEQLRNRTYVFTDPAGDELCLRPDVTIPAARLYRERYPASDPKQRYCYNGPVFRYQDGGAALTTHPQPGRSAAGATLASISSPAARSDTQADVTSGGGGQSGAEVLAQDTQPREFRQAGIEVFAESDRERADAEVFATILEAVHGAGLRACSVNFGDLGLFADLLQAMGLPARWQARLRANFWHPARFRAELEALQQPAAARVVPGEPQGLRQLVRGLDPDDQQEARVRVQDYLSDKQFTTFGNRTTAELVDRLCDYAADAAHAPLPAQAAQLITSYAAIKAPPRAAGARIVDLVSTAGLKQSEALERYQRRTNLLAQATPDWSKCLFSAEFGREMAYYTGFVFQLDVPELGRGGRLAGGGRYDGLLPSAANAQSPLSAVGAAIHTERLLRAVAEGV